MAWLLVPLVWMISAAAPAAPGDCGAVAAGKVDVATVNAWGLPGPIAPGRRWRMPRLARFLEEQGWDVVGMQEVWRGALRLLPLPDLRAPEVGGDSGLALATPHPVEDLRVRAFSEARGFDALKRKGVLLAEVHLPELGEVTVAVTHLQAGGGDRNARVRTVQLDEVLQAIDGDGPAMLMGDFNLHRDNDIDGSTRRRLEHAGWVDAAAAVGNDEPTHAWDGGQRFDRIYVRSGPRRCMAPEGVQVLAYEEALSDHRPVHATVGYGFLE